MHVSHVQQWQQLRGVDYRLKAASGPCLLSCDWLASCGPIDELDSDSKLQITAEQPQSTPSFTPILPQHPLQASPDKRIVKEFSLF